MTGPRHGPGRPAGPEVVVAAAALTRAGGAHSAAPPSRRLATAADTFAFGQRLARILRAGDLIVLTGPLGAGKTVLVQGIGAGLGVTGRVVSPTFVIARVHQGPLPLVHVDAYRLSSMAEVDDLDLDADATDSVTAVEWGSGLVEQLAEARLEIDIARSQESEERTVRLTPCGGDWPQRLSELTE